MTILWRRDIEGYDVAVSEFIRGLRDTQPTPEEFNMSPHDAAFKQTKGKGFAFRTAAQKVTAAQSARSSQAQNSPTSSNKFTSANKSSKAKSTKFKFKAKVSPAKEKEKKKPFSLRGTGITKRALEGAAKEQEKRNVTIIPESQTEILPPPEKIEELRAKETEYRLNQVPAIPEPETREITQLSKADLHHLRRQKALDDLHSEQLKRADLVRQKQKEETHTHDMIRKAALEEERQLAIREEELGKNIILDEYQQRALDGLIKQKYGCLIGGAGTGKTTVERQLADRLEETTEIIDLNRAKIDAERRDKKNLAVAICCCALTGRAVQQMKRALPQKYHQLCATIHKTLGYAPVMEEFYDDKKKQWFEKKVFRPTFTASNKLPFKICIIDEAGMLGIPLWNELIAALPDDCRIILIGDINQLPPVQGRSVLGFAMLKWPTYTLEKIHRQAADNPIIANAHRILQGKKPLQDNKKFAIVDLPWYATKALEKVSTGKANIIDQLCRKKDDKGNPIFDPFRDAIITTTNVGILGQTNMNEGLVFKFNPKKEIEGVVVNQRYIITAGYMHCHYAIGDKVMLLQNDNTKGLTNGMTGVIFDIRPNPAFIGNKSRHSVKDGETQDGTFSFEDLDEIETEMQERAKKEDEEGPNVKVEDEDESQRPSSHIVIVNFGAGENAISVQFSTAGQFKKICHAYAFTCHKSQGGEYETVVIILHHSIIRMLTREWLYTAVTRAKERVILCCTEKALNQALRIQRIKGKTVKEKAMQFMELEKLNDVKLPYIPEPELVKEMEKLQ